MIDYGYRRVGMESFIRARVVERQGRIREVFSGACLHPMRTLKTNRYVNNRMGKIAWHLSTHSVCDSDLRVWLFNKVDEFKRNPDSHANQRLISEMWTTIWHFDAMPSTFPVLQT